MKLTAKLSGSGNVFDDTHFTKATATKFKKHLAERVAARMKAQKLTLKASAEMAGCEMDDIRDIRKANVSSFEIADLIALAKKFGFGIHVSVTMPEGRKLH